MPEIAELIEVVRQGSECTLLIDGKPFPWHVSRDGVGTLVDSHGCPSVTLTIMANEVRILDALPGNVPSSIAEWQRGAPLMVDAPERAS